MRQARTQEGEYTRSGPLLQSAAKCRRRRAAPRPPSGPDVLGAEDARAEEIAPGDGPDQDDPHSVALKDAERAVRQVTEAFKICGGLKKLNRDLDRAVRACARAEYRPLAMVYATGWFLLRPSRGLSRNDQFAALGLKPSRDKVFLAILERYWPAPSEQPDRKRVQNRHSRWSKALELARNDRVTPDQFVEYLRARGGIEGLAEPDRKAKRQQKGSQAESGPEPESKPENLPHVPRSRRHGFSDLPSLPAAGHRLQTPPRPERPLDHGLRLRVDPEAQAVHRMLGKRACIVRFAPGDDATLVHVGPLVPQSGDSDWSEFDELVDRLTT